MNISVFCGASLPHNKEIVEAAAALGRRIAQEGHTLVYGGSNLGLMGVVSGAALEEGGRVVGVIPNLFSDDIIHSQRVTELVRVGSMAERKERIMEMCDAFVALPGGIGTIDEVSEVMVMNQLQIYDGQRVLDGSYRSKPMILLNIDDYYNPFLEQLRLIKEEGLMRSDAGLVSAETVEGIFSFLSPKE
ncbi:MAG: TIGR00730 family Rossman fold protein [Bacteroidales bacterium]|nr:TIGR00730 family Rossman fold protein [Bacteroidales bacterium]